VDRARLRLVAAVAVTGIGPRPVRIRWARVATVLTLAPAATGAAATAADRPRVRSWICGSRLSGLLRVATGAIRAGPIPHTGAIRAGPIPHTGAIRAGPVPHTGGIQAGPTLGMEEIAARRATADPAAALPATAARVAHPATVEAALLAVAANTIQRQAVADITPEAVGVDTPPAEVVADTLAAVADIRVAAAIPVAEVIAKKAWRR
jgi:hypothetical protein